MSAVAQAINADVRSVYQPIVELRSRTVVGYEALARGQAGSPLERPDRLFAAAREQGLTSNAGASNGGRSQTTVC